MIIITACARAGRGRGRGAGARGGGAGVVLGDVLDELGEQVAAEIGESARYCRLDVTSEADWVRAVGWRRTRSARCWCWSTRRVGPGPVGHPGQLGAPGRSR